MAAAKAVRTLHGVGPEVHDWWLQERQSDGQACGEQLCSGFANELNAWMEVAADADVNGGGVAATATVPVSADTGRNDVEASDDYGAKSPTFDMCAPALTASWVVAGRKMTILGTSKFPGASSFWIWSAWEDLALHRGRAKYFATFALGDAAFRGDSCAVEDSEASPGTSWCFPGPQSGATW